MERATNWPPFSITSRKRGVFCSGKAVERLRRGVAALRRTSYHEDLRSQGEKEPFPLLQVFLDAFHRLYDILPMPKRRQPEVPFAAVAKARAGRPDDVALGEELVEEVPAGHPARRLEPDVRGIYAAVAGDTHSGQTFADDAGVLHVVVDDLFGLLPPLVGVNRGGGLLHRVGGAVELGGGAAQPQFVEAVALARG